MRNPALPGRRATILAIAVAAALLVLAPAARAARPPVPAPVSELVGPHFVIHYTSSGGTAADRLSPEGAATALANAETALSWYLSQGYPPPMSDGDGKTDIYVFAVPIGPAAGRDDESADQTSGFILLTPSTTNIYAVAHELFHVIQFGIFAHSGFFSESSAEWAGQAVTAATGGSPPPNWFPDPWVPLDCLGPACGDAAGGYRGSIFWEYLSERYGTGIVHEAFSREAALGSADHRAHDLQALEEVLAAHGSSLAAALNGYALAAVAGQITRPGVLPHLPAPSLRLIPEQVGIYAPLSVTVNHLAMKVVSFDGAADSAAPCTRATLQLQVDLPPGVPTQPVFVIYPSSGLPPASGIYPLAISGGTASAEIPWATCAAAIGALALPNASATADGQVFTVHFGVGAGSAEHRKPRPRLSGKAVQRVGKLAIQVHVSEATTLRGQAMVSLPRVRGALLSRVASARATANRTVTLRFKFSPAKLRRIRAVLAQRRVRAKLVVHARNAEGETATVSKSVRLKR